MENTTVPLLITALVLLVSFILIVRSAFHQGLAWGFVVLLFSPLATIILGVVHWQVVKKPFMFFMAALSLYAYLFIQQFSSHGSMEIVDSVNQLRQLSLKQQQGNVSKEEAEQQMNQMMAKLTNQLDSSVKRLRDTGTISEAEFAQYQERRAKQNIGREYQTPATSAYADDPDNRAPLNVYREETRKINTVADGDKKSFEEIILEKEQQQRKQRAAEENNLMALHDKIREKKHSSLSSKPIDMKNINDYIGLELEIDDSNNIRRNGIMYKVTDDHLLLYKELYGGRLEFQIEKQNIRQIRLSKNISNRQN